MATITYSNKSFLNQNPDVPNVNKVTDNDMNEIKSVVNENYSEFQDFTDRAIATYGVSETSLSFKNTSAYQSFIIPINLRKCGAHDTNKFTLDSTNHKIIIGAGVSKIKVSGNYVVNRGSGSYMTISIAKGSTIMGSGAAYFADWSPSGPALSDIIFDVQQGDEIYFKLSVGTGDTNKTWVYYSPDKSINLTIEEIK